MAIGKKLGTAHVRVEAEVGDFAKVVITALKGDARAIKLFARQLGKDIGQEIGAGIARGIVSSRSKVIAAARALVAGVDPKISVDVDVSQLRMVAAEAGSQIEKVAEKAKKVADANRKELQANLLSAIPGVSGKMAKLIESMGKSMGLGSLNTKLMSLSISALEFAISAGMGTFVIFGQTIQNILGTLLLLPGALSVLLAAIMPLSVAFYGVGEAMKNAITAEDMDDFKKAIEDLPKPLRKIAKELRAAKDWFDDLVYTTQNALFSNLVGLIPKALRYFGPAIHSGFAKVADAFGGAIRTIVNSLFNESVLDFVMRLFQTVSEIITDLAPPLMDLTQALVQAADASLPIIQDLMKVFGEGMTNFSKWLNEKVLSGEFADWLNEGIGLLGDMWQLLSDTGTLLSVMFDEGNDEGKNFIQTLDEVITDMTRFAETEDGRLALEGFVVTAKIAGWILWGLSAAIIVCITALGSLAGAIKRLIEWIARLTRADARNWFRRLLTGVTSSIGPLDSLISRLSRIIAMTSSVKSGLGVVSGLASSIGSILGYAAGGIISSPEVAVVGESGPEVIIPLTNPARAKQLAAESGLSGIIGGDGGDTYVTVLLGDEQLMPKMVRVAKETIGASVRSARLGGLSMSAA